MIELTLNEILIAGIWLCVINILFILWFNKTYLKNSKKNKKTLCYKCGKEFEDVNYIKELPLAGRIYCNKCIKEWKK